MCARVRVCVYVCLCRGLCVFRVHEHDVFFIIQISPFLFPLVVSLVADGLLCLCVAMVYSRKKSVGEGIFWIVLRTRGDTPSVYRAYGNFHRGVTV